MLLDPSRFVHHLNSFEMSDDQKKGFLEEIWRIAHFFADQAFGLTSEQILLGTNQASCGVPDGAALDSPNHLTQTFDRAARQSVGGKNDP
jgi:hypothetical protein